MLRVPDRRARNLLDLANFIETVDPELFNMRHWCSCVCGHYMRSQGRTDVDNAGEAARLLGITAVEAQYLFLANRSPTDDPHLLDNPKQAAERIRKFAFTLVD